MVPRDNEAMIANLEPREKDDAPSSSLSRILPKQAFSFEMVGSHWGDLLEAEKMCLGTAAVEKRIREFAAGRHCARKALALLGVPEGPILRGRDREPLWPAGIVGSITHCDGYCASAVAKNADLAALGIDAEKNEPLPSGVESLVATEEETIQFRQAGSHGIHWDKLVFSAKESFFKAWFPVTRKWLEFKDVEAFFDLDQRTFRIQRGRLSAGSWADSQNLSLARLEGRYLIAGQLMLTSAWLGNHGS
jgi:4'-phosphopantetheinyl transferase EntD